MFNRIWFAIVLGGLPLCTAAAERPPAATQSASYDVSALLKPSRPDDSPAPKIPNQDPNGPIGNDPRVPTQSEARGRFIKLVRETIAPESWQAGHAPAVSIRIDGGKLVVVQTPENQRMIVSLLRQLRGDGSEKLLEAYGNTRLSPRKLNKTPWGEAIQMVAREVNVAIEVDWKSFAKSGLAADSPVTVEWSHPMAPHAVAAIFKSAAGHDVPIFTRATPKAIRIWLDPNPPEGRERETVVFDVRYLPGRASGIKGGPYSRQEALAALVDRLRKEVPGMTGIREVYGQLIITAPAEAIRQVRAFLVKLDDNAVAASNGRK